MRSKKNLLKKSRLYVILDKKTGTSKSAAGIAKLLNGSICDIIQFRDKISPKSEVLRQVKFLRGILTNKNQLFIVNDYLDVAKITCADGVHLGQGDTSVAVARRVLGEDKIIGVSCHSLKQAKEAEMQGADYIGIGPVFPTPTKPDYKPIGLRVLKKVASQIRIPHFAIGGIDRSNIAEIASCGIKRIAACRAFLRQTDFSQNLNYFRNILT